MIQPRSISQNLITLLETLKGETITIEQILAHLHERSFGFALLVFALPAALPLPAVGIGTLLGLPLVLLALQLTIRRDHVWMPRFIRIKTLKRTTLTHFVAKAVPTLNKIEILIKPRLAFITSRSFEPIIGICALIMALYVCLPFPLTNTIPSFGIAVTAIGLITRDGIAVITGLLIGLLWVLILTTALIIFGVEAFDLIKETIKGVLP
jgi:hypothetical protein